MFTAGNSVTVRPSERVAGFTLVEILIVLVIVVLALGMTLPRIGFISTSARERAALETIERAASAAALQATAQGITVTMKIIPETSRIVLEQTDDGRKRAPLPGGEKPEAGNARTYDLPSKVIVSLPDDHIGTTTPDSIRFVFLPSGECAPESPFVLTVGTRRKTVTVDALTGRIEMPARFADQRN